MLQGRGHESPLIRYRLRAPSDDLEELTGMLHEAYAPLAAAGMRFLASHQNVSMTKQRMERGSTYFAVDGEKIVGTITVDAPGTAHGTAFYRRAGVTCFEQFAVRPSYQGRGIGLRLLNLVEQVAAGWGLDYLACDTSEKARDLIAFYRRRSYDPVEYCQWDVTNYRSVVLAKRVGTA